MGLATHSDGGGIYYCIDSGPEIHENVIMSNSAAAGGGIYCTSHDNRPGIERNVIAGNTAFYGQGGGIHCTLFASPKIVNNIIYDNACNNGGGGICVRDLAEPSIFNNTIFHNYSNYNGGGVCCVDDGLMTVENSILWDNIAVQGSEIWVDASKNTVASIDHSMVDGGMSSVHVEPAGILHWGAGMIDEPPLFIDQGNRDFHLDWASPCINQGTNDGAPAKDLDGLPRPQAGTVDIGAYEFAGTHRLDADVFTLSETGGSVTFTVTGGIENAYRKYFLLGSLTGTVPGSPLPGGQAKIRINWDPFTDLVWSLLNTPLFEDFSVQLDSSGLGSGKLNAPPLPPGFVGLKMHYAYCLGWPWELVSNPVEIMIVD
jgi:parallel beta-helix repeat protein